MIELFQLSFAGQMLNGFFATWMHNDGRVRNLFEQRNPVSALLSSIGKKGIGASRLTLKSK